MCLHKASGHATSVSESTCLVDVPRMSQNACEPPPTVLSSQVPSPFHFTATPSARLAPSHRFSFYDPLDKIVEQMVKSHRNPRAAVHRCCSHRPQNGTALPIIEDQMRVFIAELLRKSRLSRAALIVGLHYIDCSLRDPNGGQWMLHDEARDSLCCQCWFTAALILATKYLFDKSPSMKFWASASRAEPSELIMAEQFLLGRLEWALHVPKDVFASLEALYMKNRGEVAPAMPSRLNGIPPACIPMAAPIPQQTVMHIPAVCASHHVSMRSGSSLSSTSTQATPDSMRSIRHPRRILDDDEATVTSSETSSTSDFSSIIDDSESKRTRDDPLYLQILKDLMETCNESSLISV
jgi:hypothetical protein